MILRYERKKLKLLTVESTSIMKDYRVAITLADREHGYTGQICATPVVHSHEIPGNIWFYSDILEGIRLLTSAGLVADEEALWILQEGD